MYKIESMSIDYCGQMCKGAHDSIFMGVQGTNCYCMNEITGSLLLSNRACNTRCPGDAAELCGGKGSLSLHQLKNESFTDVLAVVSGSLKGKKNWDYFGHWKRTTEIVFETLPHYCIYRCCQFSVTGKIEEREKFTSKCFPTLPCSGRGTLWALRNMEEALDALRNTPGLVHVESCVDMGRNVNMQ